MQNQARPNSISSPLKWCAMTVKTGQKCTAIRKALVPRSVSGEVVAALQAALQKIIVGDPRAEGVRMGPLVSQEQRTEVLERVEELHREAELVSGDLGRFEVKDADRERGAFVPPLLLLCNDIQGARAIHEVEAFGPVATVLPYKDTAEAITLARAAQRRQPRRLGVYRRCRPRHADRAWARRHGRILVVNQAWAKESTGHGSPLAPLIRGGPGRADRGGEEMGGIRGVLHYMQRTARCRPRPTPSPPSVGAGYGATDSSRKDTTRFAFLLTNSKLGDTLKSRRERQVTVGDIEQFAALTGDNFYAQ